jgi:uncharacterized protein YgbK (DUF1537 family)
VSGGPLLAFYGDDFTGSTDVLEALGSNGLSTVLFTRIPTGREHARFAACRAVGLAGISRSQSPEWMDENLPAIFGWLRSLDARLCHYKVCSTFDSAPRLGSIGRAMEIGLDTFGQHVAPIVVGAPQMRRYTIGGNLFAGYREGIYRIDRHPVMASHPATPMDEADLRLHLARQTALPVILDGGEVPPEGRHGLLIDVHCEASQKAGGRRLRELADAGGRFVVGSSGIEYALLADGSLLAGAAEDPGFAPLAPVERMAVVSGSCSPTTARQIRRALDRGFAGVPADFAALARGDGAKVLDEASRMLKEGRSPIVYTALGGEDTQSADAPTNAAVGRALGDILRALVDRFDLPRAAIAGGDTSSHALAALDVLALTLRLPVASSRGSPVCTAHRDGCGHIEIMLKGGQIGGDDHFAALRDGTIA